MKRSYLTVALSSVLILTACDQNQNQQNTGDDDSADPQTTYHPSGTPGGNHPPPETSQTTDIEIASLQNSLSSWEYKLGELGREMDQLGDRVGSETRAAFGDMQSRLASLNATLNNLKDQGEGTWKEVKAKVESGLKELGESFKKLTSELSD